MKSIVVANPKGGCGKTTLAAQLASFYADTGHQVGLLDCDVQCSASDWLKSRPASCGSIVLLENHHEDSGQNCDVLIRDMPAGCDSDALANVVGEGDYLLIPMLPSPTDIKAGVRFLMALNRSGWIYERSVHVGLIANRVRTNTSYFKVLQGFLEQVNMPLITSIRDTQNYIRAMDAGISIFDLPPSRVQKDLQQWQELIDWLDDSGETLTQAS